MRHRSRLHRPFRLLPRVLAVLTLAVVAPACSDGEGDPGGSAEAPVGESGELRLLSYNVAGLPAEISKERPDVNIPLISPLLEPFDVVLTQEDFDWWRPDGLAAGLDFTKYHERLLAATTHEYRTDRHPGPEAVGLEREPGSEPEVGDGLAVLSRRPIADTERVPWAGCFGGFDTSDGGAADCLAMKGFLVTRLTLGDGAQVHVYNLHAEAGGTAADQQLQVEDFEQLARFMAEHSADAAVILGGDTNLHTDLVHPDGAAGADIEIWERFLATTGLTDACAATGCPEPGRIDKFAFRSGSGVTLEALEYGFRKEFVDAAGEDLSDHEALELRVRWTAA